MGVEKKVLVIVAMIAFVLLFGTLSFHRTEGWSYFESFFFTIITVSTVGYSLPEKVSLAGKVTAVILVGAGISIVLYGFTTLTSFIVEGHMRDYMRRRRIAKMMEKMRDHFIVVGAGRTGRHTVAEIRKAKKPVVVIDVSQRAIDLLRTVLDEDVPYIVGDATEEEVLLKAGVDRAKTLIITLPDDTKNTFVVLTARSLNPNLEIIARVSDRKSYNKLLYAGASKVIVTSQVTGQRLAQMALNPSMVNFLDVLSFGGIPIRVEEIRVPEGCPITGKTLGELNLSRKIGVFVIAVMREGETIFNPTGEMVILAGDRLLVIGKEENFQKLHELMGTVL